jgi:hypothetical protein
MDKEYILKENEYFYIPIKLIDNKMFMWHSICSIHRSHNKDCGMCNAGSWMEIGYETT